LATGVIAALAIAAPVAEASAATPVVIPVPNIYGLPALLAPLLSGVGGYVGYVGVAIAGPAIGDVFNGGTTVVISSSPAFGTTIGSP
jgi:hypothetical protein